MPAALALFITRLDLLIEEESEHLSPAELWALGETLEGLETSHG